MLQEMITSIKEHTDYTNEEIARIIGCHQSTIARMVSGETKKTDHERYRAIEELYEEWVLNDVN